MPISHLQPRNGPEFRERSFKRGFWKNLFAVILFLLVISGLIFLAVLLYAGPPIGELADKLYKYFSELFK